jgi:hypothetical protein
LSKYCSNCIVLKLKEPLGISEALGKLNTCFRNVGYIVLYEILLGAEPADFTAAGKIKKKQQRGL